MCAFLLDCMEYTYLKQYPFITPVVVLPLACLMSALTIEVGCERVWQETCFALRGLPCSGQMKNVASPEAGLKRLRKSSPTNIKTFPVGQVTKILSPSLQRWEGTDGIEVRRILVSRYSSGTAVVGFLHRKKALRPLVPVRRKGELKS